MYFIDACIIITIISMLGISAIMIPVIIMMLIIVNAWFYLLLCKRLGFTV